MFNEKSKSLWHNVVNYFFASSSRVLLLLLLIVAGRYLGVEDFGRFSFALAFVFLFEPILDPGLYHFLVREIARQKASAEKYLSHALTWKLAIAPVFILAVVIGVNIIHSSRETLQAVYLMTGAAFFKSVKDAFRATLLAYECFGLDAISLTIERIGLLLIGAWLLVNGHGLLPLCWAFCLVRLLDLFIIGALVRYKICRVSLGLELSFIKHMAITAFPIGAFYITLNIYNYVDTVMLSMFRSNAEVGWYNASYRVYEGLLIVPATISTVFLPRLAQLYKNQTGIFEGLVARGLKYILVISLLVSVNGMIFSAEIVALLFGDEYMRSRAALNILLAGVVGAFTLNFLQTVAITIDRQKTVLAIAMLGLLLNIGLNLFLIPRFGHLGAAAATVIAESVICILLCSYIYQVVQNIDWWHVIGKPAISMLVPVAIIWLLYPNGLIYATSVVVNVGFVLLLFWLRFFDSGELSAFSRFVRFRRGLSG